MYWYIRIQNLCYDKGPCKSVSRLPGFFHPGTRHLSFTIKPASIVQLRSHYQCCTRTSSHNWHETHYTTQYRCKRDYPICASTLPSISSQSKQNFIPRICYRQGY